MEKIIRPDYFQIPTIILDDDDLNMMDGIVYAVIYWYTKLKLEKCTASNETIAKMVKSTKNSVANSISRLSKKKFIRVVMDKNNHRVEIVPMITFSAPSPVDESPSLTDEPPLTPELTPPSLTSEQNKNNISKRFNKNINNTNSEVYTETKGYIAQNSNSSAVTKAIDPSRGIALLTQIQGREPIKRSLNETYYRKCVEAFGQEKAEKGMFFAHENQGKKACPLIANWADLYEKWDSLKAWANREGIKTMSRVINVSDMIRQMEGNNHVT